MIFADKTVVITGAGTGIGRGYAIGFCNDGADVIGIGRSRENLAQTAALCAGKMRYVVGDISLEEDVERLFAEVSSCSDKLDILINNAAIYPKVRFLECSHSEWAKVIEINVLGMALCCRKALPGMLERGYGRILNIGSFAGNSPIPKASAYSVSKGAVHVLTKALVAEIDKKVYPDILINELIPGMVKTAMSEDGEEPADVYVHAKYVASLPANGPTGQTFIQSQLHIEEYGIRARLRRLLSRISGGLSKL